MPTFIEELPARTYTSARGSKYNELADALKANEGQWADITEDLLEIGVTEKGLDSAAGNIRRATFAAFKPAKSFEAADRLEDGERRVFAKYVGEQPEVAAPVEESAEA